MSWLPSALAHGPLRRSTSRLTASMRTRVMAPACRSPMQCTECAQLGSGTGRRVARPARLVDRSAVLADEPGRVRTGLQGQLQHSEDVGAQVFAIGRLRPRVGVEAAASRADYELPHARGTRDPAGRDWSEALVVVRVTRENQLGAVFVEVGKQRTRLGMRLVSSPKAGAEARVMPVGDHARVVG